MTNNKKQPMKTLEQLKKEMDDAEAVFAANYDADVAANYAAYWAAAGVYEAALNKQNHENNEQQ